MIFKNLKDLFGSGKAKIETSKDFQKWRAMIFSISPEQVDILKSQANQVYGVIMDIGMVDRQSSTNWAISLSAFPTGETSFHPTPGGSVIGLGNDPKVDQTAKDIVHIAQNLLPQTTSTQDFSLPEPGYVQFFFLTTSGVRVVKDHLDKLQQPGGSFVPLLERFGFIRQFADEILDKKRVDNQDHNHNLRLKAIYILIFTPEKLDSKNLLSVSRLASEMLEAKDPIFKRLIQEQVESKTPIEIANQQYLASMHTPQVMQSTMKGWLDTQYKVNFNPVEGSNFFPHGMRNPQGRTNYVMFYFDFEGA